MKRKKSLTSAFTLIELLVVITIIGILASIALPVFNSVQLRGAQTKVLAQAKQVGLALKLYSSDNSGSYPVYAANASAVPPFTGGSAGAGNTSNLDFFPLFPTYTQSESIFANKYNYYNDVVPDNVIDPLGSGHGKTLADGENSFAYFEGLSDSFNASTPIVMDAGTTTGTYLSTPNVAGFDFGNNKVVVVHLDNSASLDTMTGTVAGGVTTYMDMAGDPTNPGVTATINILYPKAYNALTGVALAVPSRK